MFDGYKMNAFASELERQMNDSDSFAQLGFEERLGLLVDSEWNRRQVNKLNSYVAVFDPAQIRIIDKTPISELQKDSESLESDGRFQIYQLPDGEQYRGIRFESMETLEKEDVKLNFEDYDLMYQGSISDFAGEHLLEEIFSEFNTDRPADFMGHSLSVSDVIVTEIDGEQKAYYCDKWLFRHDGGLKLA